MNALTTDDPTQPPINPSAPRLRDDLLNWEPPTRAARSLDVFAALAEPPD